MVGTRKVISGAVLLGVGLVVTFYKGDIPTNLLSLMQLLYAAFVVGNFGEHATAAYTATKKGNV